MTSTSVTGSGPGSATARFPFRSLQEITRIQTSDGRAIFEVENGRLIFKDNILASAVDIVSVAFDASALTDVRFIHAISRQFVAGVTLYDNTNEIVLPDSIRISGLSIEVDLTSFLPLPGIWHLVYLG
jgi:hypothetical protein